MPQIFVMLSPKAQTALEFRMQEMLEKLEQELSSLIARMWFVPGDDIAFSAINLLRVRNEADVQIEVRYTAGKIEYGRKDPFDPTHGDQADLSHYMIEAVYKLFDKQKLSCSVWTKPYYKSAFQSRP